MKLLHVIHDFLPRHRAGAEVYVLRLCQALVKRSDQVTVLCGEFAPQRAHGELVRRRVEGLPVWEVTNNWVGDTFEQTYRDPLINQALTRAIERLRPDIIHIHSLLNLSLDLPLLAEAAGIPCIATLHDYSLFCASGGQMLAAPHGLPCQRIVPGQCARCLAHSPYLGLGRAGKLASSDQRLRAMRRLNRRMCEVWPAAAAAGQRVMAATLPGPTPTAADLRHREDHLRQVLAAVDRFVAPSRALAQAAVRLGLPRDRLEVSDYGTPPGERHEARPPWSGHGPLHLGFVGTLAPHKGAHLLLDALDHLPDGRVKVSLFGDPATAPWYAATLRRQARGRPVTFRGPFDPAEVDTVYRDLDLLVVPSLWQENSPLVIHEALAAGVPVLGARIGGIPELVRPGKNGLLFAPHSARDLARAVSRVLATPTLLPRLVDGIMPLKTVGHDAEQWHRRYGELNKSSNKNTNIYHRLAKKNPSPFPVSVLLLTRDGAATLPKLLAALDRQQCDLRHEVVALDSGSSDNTVALLRDFGIKPKQIPSQRFNHGTTRNLGLSRCQGDFVVLLAQDALPSSDRWLDTLVRPLRDDPTLAGSHGRLLPRTDAGPLARHLAAHGLPFQLPTTPRAITGPAELAELSPLQRYRLCAFDNVCSCIRRSVWRYIPFRRVSFGEDISWAKDVLLAGHRLLYTPDAVVRHSHQRSVSYEFVRDYLAHRQLRRLFGLRTVPSASHLPLAVVATLVTNLRCLAEAPASPDAQHDSLYRAAGLALARPLGQYLGTLAADSGRRLLSGEGV